MREFVGNRRQSRGGPTRAPRKRPRPAWEVVPTDVEPSESDKVTPSPADSGQAAAAVQTASLVYESYYGLKEKPFSLAADPRFFYKSHLHSTAFNDLLAAIRRREGLVVLTGDIGTGKTTLCRSVLEHLDQKTFTTFVPDPSVSHTDLLKILLVDFGVMSVDDLKRGRLNGASRPDLSYPLYEFLISLVPLQAFAVLIIDEAQNLSQPVLEEIRILLDLEGREKLLQVVLVGQPDLQRELRRTRMRQVGERVTMRCELGPLSREAVAGYVAHRLNVAGGGKERIEFSAGALDVVYGGSGGVPRRINLICDRALHRGYLMRTARIDPEIVRSAVTDLGLTPTPEAPESVTVVPPRGLCEKTPEQTGQSPSPMDLNALFDIRLMRQRQPSQAAAQIEHPEPKSSDPVANGPPEVPEAGGPEGTAGCERRGARRVMLTAAALLLAGLAGAIGAGLGYLWAVRQSLADPMSRVYLPPPPSLAMARDLEAPLPPAAAQVTEWLLEPVAEPVSREPSSPGTEVAGPYAIHVAYFEAPLRASLVGQQLTSAGYRAYQVEVPFGPLGRLHEVLVGPYGTAAEAQFDLDLIRQISGSADARVLNAPRLAP